MDYRDLEAVYSAIDKVVPSILESYDALKDWEDPGMGSLMMEKLAEAGRGVMSKVKRIDDLRKACIYCIDEEEAVEDPDYYEVHLSRVKKVLSVLDEIADWLIEEVRIQKEDRAQEAD